MSLRTKALTAVIAGNTIFGFSFLFSKVALQMTVPGVLLAARFLTAFAVLNIIVIFGRLIKNRDGEPIVKFSLRGKPLKDVLLLALFQPVIYFAAESYGIQFTSSAFAGTIIAVIPVMGVISDVIIMKAAVSWKQIICALTSVAGVALTTLGARGMKSSAAGVIVLMAAVVAGALFYVFSKKAGEHFNPLERTYVMFGAGSAVYVCFALIACAGDYDRLITDVVTMPEFWGCIMYLAVASSVIAFIALNYGSSHVSVSEASLFANLTTVISIIAGVAVLHESFTLQQIAGAAVIIASVYVSSADKDTAIKSKCNG
ncbi:MAG: DMT family transporter [Lentihominibacter sp.]